MKIWTNIWSAEVELHKVLIMSDRDDITETQTKDLTFLCDIVDTSLFEVYLLSNFKKKNVFLHTIVLIEWFSFFSGQGSLNEWTPNWP